MNRLWLLILLIFLAASALAAEKEIVLFQWTDAESKVHYTDNFNSIPQQFRDTVVQGVFTMKDAAIPAKNAKKKPDPAPANSAGNNQAKYSNKIELLEDSYFEENGYLHIRGKVKNGFYYSVSFIKVKVGFYDKNDMFIKQESTYVDPIELQPGDVGTYNLLVKILPEIASYKTEVFWK